MQTLIHDPLRCDLPMFVKNPGFTGVAIPGAMIRLPDATKNNNPMIALRRE